MHGNRMPPFLGVLSRLGRLMLGVTVLLVLAVLGGAAGAEPLKVMSAGAVSEGLKVLAAGYTKSSGVEVTLVIGNVGMIQDRLKAGEATDVLILSASALAEIARSDGLAAGGGGPRCRPGIGVPPPAAAAPAPPSS